MGVVCILILVAQLVLVAAVVTSWFHVQPGTAMESVAVGLQRLTAPVLAPLRGVVNQFGLDARGIDLTPLIVLIVLFIARVVIGC